MLLDHCYGPYIRTTLKYVHHFANIAILKYKISILFLKNYISRKDKDLNRLMEYGKLFKIDNVIRRYMEVLLWNANDTWTSERKNQEWSERNLEHLWEYVQILITEF